MLRKFKTLMVAFLIFAASSSALGISSKDASSSIPSDNSAPVYSTLGHGSGIF